MIKLFITGLLSFLLIGGYVGSQYFYWLGISPAWMSVVDVTSVKLLSTGLFLSSILYFMFGKQMPENTTEITGDAS